MGDVAKAGRTVILVSHQMNQIRRLCPRIVWVEEGKVHMDGPGHSVLAAYESAMAATDIGSLGRGAVTGGKFLRWEIAGSESGEPHVLSQIGPVTVNFVVETARNIEYGEHGVALFAADRQLMWAKAAQNLSLPAGVHVLSHSFPMLPLRPGAYQWQVTLWDGDDLLDQWDSLPEMNIATEIHQHHSDEWNGILNVPSTFANTILEEKALGRK